MSKNQSFIKKSGFIICAVIAIGGVIAWKTANATPKTITRAAVDVGSGGLKVTVAKIDPLSQKIHKIVYSKEHSVPLKRDMQVGGNSEFSQEIQQTALNTLANLQTELEPHKPQEWTGIATAASRQAKNGQKMYDKIEQELGMRISIISQQEEGRLGFLTAAAVSEVPQDLLVSFDSGSGSFQLTTQINGELEVIEGQLGHIPSLEVLMNLRGQTLDFSTLPEPVTLEEASLLVQEMRGRLPELSPAFIQKLKDPNTVVVGIGNENFIFAMGSTAVGKKTYTKAELWSAIEKHAGKPASEMQNFSKPHESVLGMVLLYTIMDGLGIDQLTYSYANGSCEGLLIDANYWAPVK
jgi:exopolyphosphatase/guanosine-5'-triphosphate,3'-diphosphate pyrophosphatase